MIHGLFLLEIRMILAITNFRVMNKSLSLRIFFGQNFISCLKEAKVICLSGYQFIAFWATTFKYNFSDIENPHSKRNIHSLITKLTKILQIQSPLKIMSIQDRVGLQQNKNALLLPNIVLLQGSINILQGLPLVNQFYIFHIELKPFFQFFKEVSDCFRLKVNLESVTISRQHSQINP